MRGHFRKRNKKKNNGDVKSRLEQSLFSVSADNLIKSPTMTLNEFLIQWLETYAKHNTRATTYAGYETFIRRHILPEIGNIELDKLTAFHLQQLYAKKTAGGRADGRAGGLSARSVRLIHSIMHEALNHAVKWRLIPYNVALEAEPPKNKSRKKQVWSAGQAARFLESIKGHRLYALYHLALTTGMRRGELLGLRWRDVDFNEGVVVVEQNLVVINGRLNYQEPKTESSCRAVLLPPSAVEVLKQHKLRQDREKHLAGVNYLESGLVFCQENGQPLWPDNISKRQFRGLIEKAGLPRITFHDLRRTHVTLLIAGGVDPRQVADRIGHSSLTITLGIYNQVTRRRQEEAARLIDQILFKE